MYESISFLFCIPTPARPPAVAAVQETLTLDPAYLWLAGVGLLFLLLLGAFAYVLVRRHRDWLGERFQQLDRLLAAHAPRLWRFIRSRFSRDAWHGLTLTVAACVCLFTIYLFAEITQSWIGEGLLYRIDQAVNQALHGALSDGAVHAIAVFSYLGSFKLAFPITLLLALALVFRRAWWRLLSLFMVMGVGTAFMWGLKWSFARTRPEGILSTPPSASFPSGHAFTAMALYGFMIFLLWRLALRPSLRVPLTVLLAAVIVLIGLSRVLLSVHWTSDVIGGFTIGLAWLVFSLVFTRALQDLAPGRTAPR